MNVPTVSHGPSMMAGATPARLKSSLRLDAALDALLAKLAEPETDLRLLAVTGASRRRGLEL